MARSVDGGVTWVSAGRPIDNRGRGVAYGNGLFVVVGQSNNGNQVFTSPSCTDGSFTGRSNLFRNGGEVMAVAYGASGFVAVGQHNGEPNSVITSPDGLTWTGRGKAVLQGAGTDVVYVPQLSVWLATASGGINFGAYSADGGATWVGTGALTFDTAARAVIYAPVAFTANATTAASMLVAPLLAVALLVALL